MKSINMKSKLSLWLFTAASLLVMSESAFALKCNWVNSAPAERQRSITFGNVIAQRDAPVGTVLATTWSQSYASGEGFMSCTTAWQMALELSLFTTLSSYGNKVYNTNIAGVGLKLTTPDGDVFPLTKAMGGNVVARIITPGVAAQLIKTSAGATGTGTLSSGRLGGFRIVSNPAFFADLLTLGTTTITSGSCSINNTTVNVPLTPATTGNFSGVGSTAKPKDFNITLNCNSGTKIKLTLDGSRAGPMGVLNLNSGAGQAGGIGIQLLRSGGAVPFGVELNFPTSGGTTQLGLTARYYQTAIPIVPGTTNAAATFTLTYN